MSLYCHAFARRVWGLGLAGTVWGWLRLGSLGLAGEAWAGWPGGRAFGAAKPALPRQLTCRTKFGNRRGGVQEGWS